jgi:large subunit ribosomal protein L21
MSYAIISVGGKQYRVSEGEKLLVDRVRADEGTTFTPPILMLGGDGDPQFSPSGVTVTARVVQHVLGEKIRIGKYKPKKGYKRHAGHRSRLSQIEIESIGKKAARSSKAKEKAEAAAEETAAPAEKKPRATRTKKEES